MRNLKTRRRGVIVAGLMVIILGIAPLAMATPDSNSIIIDGIEYYIQTDKSVYSLGENVEMRYRITNLRDEDVTFSCFELPVYQFRAEQDEVQIWSAPIVRLPVSVVLTLQPGEFRMFPNDFPPPFIWNMRDYGNDLVGIGNYNIIGGLYDGQLDVFDYTEIGVSIEIVPEPSTILLISLGLVGIRKKHHHKFR